MKKLLVLNKKLSKGFTLIELLIVIAVIGVLAAVILVAIDPFEQLSRGRDAGRKTTIAQLGRALQAYYTNSQAYPVTAGWTNSDATNVLVLSGDIRRVPVVSGWPAALGTLACSTGTFSTSIPNVCYKVDSTSNQAIVYTKMESRAERNKVGCVGTFAQIFFVYSTIDGRGGTVNLATGEPAANTVQTFCP
jgi:prepilin-type N-terminal cleavage/methylation domain-containing protein